MPPQGSKPADKPKLELDQHLQREHLLGPLLRDVTALAERALAVLTAELPAYSGQHRSFLEDVVDQLRRNYTILLTALIEERPLQGEDLAFQRGASMRRARAGFALEDYLAAYRLGQQVLWDAIVEFSFEVGTDHRLVLTLASELMRQMDFATTHAGQSYVEFRQHALAAAAKERRDLLEHLLEGSLPRGGQLAVAADVYRFEDEMLAVTAAAFPRAPASDRDALEMASATFARCGLQEPSALVVIRHNELVVISRLATDRELDRVCLGLERAQELLGAEGTPLAIGVSTVAHGSSELPNSYREATVAARFVGKAGGVVALSRLPLLEYLARSADETALRLIEPRVAAFLAEDRRRGSVMVSTIRAYHAAGLSLKRAAIQLHVHTNTLQYRLHRVEELTGLDPRCAEDIHSLLVALAVDAASRGSS